LLSAFEYAEISPDLSDRARLLTIVIVGGGATGVEMAGTVAELTRYTLRGNFRRINPAEARVILVEAGPRLLASFSEVLSRYAAAILRQLGIDVRLNTKVEQIDEDSVQLADARVRVGTVIWAAGVRAADGAGWVGAPSDKEGRIRVATNMEVEGQRDIYALGDVALFMQGGSPLPALAQVAEQQGRHLGLALRRGGAVPPFRYRSKGDTAVIGRHSAVYSYGSFNFSGRPAWLLWSFVHIYLLIGFQRRTLVMVQWIWRYFTFERGARLID
jgi:NADH dehydrogenase